ATEDWPPAEWPYGNLVRFKESAPVPFSQAVQGARNSVEILFSLERIESCDCYRAGDGVHRVWLEKRKTFEPAWKKSLRFSNGKPHQLPGLAHTLRAQQGTLTEVAGPTGNSSGPHQFQTHQKRNCRRVWIPGKSDLCHLQRHPRCT